MTTTSSFWGSLFWGGTTSSCNDDPRSCDGDPTSCDDDPVPADRTPLVEASGMAGVPPWSPMIGAGHAPGRAGLRTAPLIAGLGGFSAGLAMLLGPATGTDLSAQQARAAFAGAYPGAAVDLRWYGGVLPAAYSVTAPYVEAVVGARLTGILAAVVAAPLLAMLLLRWRVRRPVLASVWGALALAVNMVSGRTAFALGMLVAIGALLAVPRGGARATRWVPAVLLAALTTLTSPVAALFLALVALAWALERRGVAWLAVGAAVPMVAIAALFSEPGRMPDTWAVARPVLLACLAIAVLCRGVPLRAGAVVYGIGALVVYLAPGPIGSNVERLALLFTGAALLAASWLPRVLLVVAVVLAAQWTARVPWADLHTSHRLTVERASSERLVDLLHGLGPITGRLEVVPFADHGESRVVAQAWPLARGWERQVDVLRDAPLYSSRLDADGYLRWLQQANVSYVALGRHTHDWSARSELRVLRTPPPWLTVVHSDPEWTIWRVGPAHPIVGGAASTVSVHGDRIVLDAPVPGVVPVGVRWSRWLTVSGGACIRPAGSTTEVVVRRPGRITVSSSYTAPFTGRHC